MPSAGLLISLAVGVAALAFVAAPLFRKDAAEAERVAVALSEGAELLSRKEMLLGALRDLEDDRATSKIDDEDYAELHAKFSGRAVEVIKRLDALDEEQKASATTARPRRIPKGKSPGKPA